MSSCHSPTRPSLTSTWRGACHPSKAGGCVWQRVHGAWCVAGRGRRGGQVGQAGPHCGAQVACALLVDKGEEAGVQLRRRCLGLLQLVLAPKDGSEHHDGARPRGLVPPHLLAQAIEARGSQVAAFGLAEAASVQPRAVVGRLVAAKGACRTLPLQSYRESRQHGSRGALGHRRCELWRWWRPLCWLGCLTG